MEKIEKTASTIKTAENRPPDPYIPEKSMSRAFQRVSRIALKLRDIREKWVLLRLEVAFSIFKFGPEFVYVPVTFYCGVV